MTSYAGFITAAAFVRPGRLSGMEPSSVKKKLKDKAFARSVSREDIFTGAEEAGLELDQHIRFVIAAMSQVAPDLGLAWVLYQMSSANPTPQCSRRTV